MPPNLPNERISRYLDYLPAPFHEDPFVGHFLLAFERVLTGLIPSDINDPLPEQPGLEAYIDRLHTYFTPGQSSTDTEATPTEFLPWLASWVALSLRDDWSEDFKRQFIGKVVSLYRKRGTKAGLQELLQLYTGEKVAIYEYEEPNYYFQIDMTLGDVLKLSQKREIALALIDQEKPAHTYYALKLLITTIQINNVYQWPDDTTKENWTQKEVSGLRIGWNMYLGNTIPTQVGKPD